MERETSSATKVRSPAYPVMDLEKAIGYANRLYSHAKLHETSRQTVADAWKISPSSGGFLGYSAALKHFGLMTSSGAKENQRYALTKDAERIILDLTDSPEKREAIQRAALAPKIYSELWDKFAVDGIDGGVEESALRNYLVFDRPGPKYTPDAAPLVIRHYRSTMTFANFQAGNRTPDPSETDPPSEAATGVQQPSAEGAPGADADDRVLPGERELVRGTFAPDGGFRLIVRGEDLTPRHFKLMLAQIILHADIFGVADPKILRLADAIIPDDVLPPEK